MADRNIGLPILNCLSAYALTTFLAASSAIDDAGCVVAFNVALI